MAERGVEGVLETLEKAKPPPLPPYVMHVRRDRHPTPYPPGYFDELVQQRIPFPWRDGTSRTGVLIEVAETETYIELWFEDVRPDDGAEDAR